MIFYIVHVFRIEVCLSIFEELSSVYRSHVNLYPTKEEVRGYLLNGKV